MQSAPDVRASRPADGPTDDLFYTNRCKNCGRALTKLEILNRMSNPRGICPCGSVRFISSNFKWWEELFLLRSWKLYFAIRAGLLAPPPSAQQVAENRITLMKKVVETEGDEPELDLEGAEVLTSDDFGEVDR